MSDLKVRPTNPGDAEPFMQSIVGDREEEKERKSGEHIASGQAGAQRAAPLHEHVDGVIQTEKEISLERLEFLVPDRGGMPGIEKYAHLVLADGSHRVVGSTEASRGCKHLCRHCPIVPVYDGVFRIVQRDVVMADVRQQVAAGARHISFGDPDFFNGIKHALGLMEEFHREFPDVTYDVTIKIEHLRKYEKELSTLKSTGCLFVISAVEAVDDGILLRLDKGHTREDFVLVARKFRELGMTLQPTFVAFTPWTTLEGYLDLLRVIVELELVENVAPVQLGIRLLIPEGSRLLELAETRELVGGFDAESLVYPWRNADERVDRLSEAVQMIAADADAKKMSRSEAFARIWEEAHLAAGVEASPLELGAGKAVPFLSEPWYCCAEPTKAQLVSIGAVSSGAKKAETVAGGGGERAGFAADGFV
ncbi:MAG TPA: radical SAM protein, partial [Candidatus Acidoferrum sp.]|nr:radical SAM protein [Candidatus Acidoferrum sp.]